MPIERGPTRLPRWKGDPPAHPKHAYINENGMRSLDGEGRVFPSELDGHDVVWINSNGFSDGQTVAVVELSAEGLDFLIQSLPHYDRFTKDLEYAQTLAKEIVYDREAKIA